MRTALLVLAATLCAPQIVVATEDGLSAPANAAYLAAHAKKPGAIIRPSGLQYQVLRSGVGRRPGRGDVVQIRYAMRLINGTVVDSTTPSLPAAVLLSSVSLAGLGEALSLMREGDRWEVTLPPILAFGAKGGGNGAIPPDQALIFDVTVVSVTMAPAAAPAGSNSSFGFTSNNGHSRAYWVLRP